MHVVTPVAQPDAQVGMAGGDVALRGGAQVGGQCLGPRREELTDQRGGDHQHQARLGDPPGDAPHRDPGRADRDQLAACGHAAETEQAADQRRGRQHLHDPAWQRHADVGEGIGEAVAVAADVLELDDQAEERVQRGQCQHREQRRLEHLARQVAVQRAHGDHVARPVAGQNGSPSWRRSNHQASNSGGRCAHHRPSQGASSPLPSSVRPAPSRFT